MMKRIKWCVGILMISLALMLGSELYQNYLKTFTNQFYYFEVNEPMLKEEACEKVEEIAKQNNVGVFAVSIFTDTAFSCEVKIYTTEEAKETFEKYYLEEGVKKSLFSGNVTIMYKNFSELKDVVSASQRYYFVGSQEETTTIKKNLGEQYDVSRFVRIEQQDEFDFLIWAVWGLVYAILLMLTLFDIKLQSKENFIQMSMGVPCKKLIAKNVLSDACVFSFSFGIIGLLLSNLINLEYRWQELLVMFGIFLVFNSFLYLKMFKYDYKQVLYGAVINYKTLGNCYILKAISMIIAIITLAVSMELIAENTHYLDMYEEIEKYGQYYYLTVKADTSMATDENEGSDIQQDTECRIFYDYYKQGKVALDINMIVENDDSPIISINQYTVGVPKFISDVVKDDFVGYYIFIPKEQENEKNLAEDVYIRTVLSFEGFVEQVDYEAIIYEEDIDMLYFDNREVSDLEFGFDKESNPIIVYFSNMKECTDYKFDDVYYVHDSIMYRFTEDDIEQLKETYNLREVKVTKVTEQCEQYKASFLRKVLIVTVISAFMMLLEMIIMMTIIRTEYVVNARELAVKKVLGYSIWKKNRELILLNLFSAMIALTTMMVIHFMYNVLTLKSICVSGTIIYLLEQIFMIYYINRIERVNVSKILKGGSL